MCRKEGKRKRSLWGYFPDIFDLAIEFIGYYQKWKNWDFPSWWTQISLLCEDCLTWNLNLKFSIQTIQFKTLQVYFKYLMLKFSITVVVPFLIARPFLNTSNISPPALRTFSTMNLFREGELKWGSPGARSRDTQRTQSLSSSPLASTLPFIAGTSFGLRLHFVHETQWDRTS